MCIDVELIYFDFVFRNMQLKKIRRAEKKGSESVVDEKFALYFCTSVAIGSDLSFPVCILFSLYRFKKILFDRIWLLISLRFEFNYSFKLL